MKKMAAAFCWVGFLVFILSAVPALAQGPHGLSISGAGIPFVGGEAGSGYGAPEYADAFETGWGVRVEPYYDIAPKLRGLLGFTYQRWGGKTYHGVDFDDLNLWSIYVGAKFRFLPGHTFRPYLLADFGYAHLNSVDISIGGTGRYWDGTDTFMLDFGGGVEYMVTPNFGIYLDVREQVFGEPDSAQPPSSDAENGVSIPVSIGLNFNF
jgi:opacity protein-like surface antigen